MPQPIDPSNSMTPTQAEAAAPAGLLAAGTSLRSPELGRGRPCWASSIYDPTHPASAANNGNAYDGWSPTADDKAAAWQVDLGAAHAIDTVEVVSRWGHDQPETRRSYRVIAGLDPQLNDGVEIGRVGKTGLRHRAIYAARPAAPVRGRYLRVEKTQPGYFFLAEVRVHGKPAP